MKHLAKALKHFFIDLGPCLQSFSNTDCAFHHRFKKFDSLSGDCMTLYRHFLSFLPSCMELKSPLNVIFLVPAFISVAFLWCQHSDVLCHMQSNHKHFDILCVGVNEPAIGQYAFQSYEAAAWCFVTWPSQKSATEIVSDVCTAIKSKHRSGWVEILFIRSTDRYH